MKIFRKSSESSIIFEIILKIKKVLNFSEDLRRCSEIFGNCQKFWRRFKTLFQEFFFYDFLKFRKIIESLWKFSEIVGKPEDVIRTVRNS